MSQRRKIAVRVAGAVVAVIGLLYLGSLLAGTLAEPVAFFAERPNENEPLVFAHQGGEAIGPSNTMVAFQLAVELGADVLDTDMHRTVDGALVLIHDTTVDRTSNGTGAVADLSLEELRRLDFGFSYTPDEGATYPHRGRGVGIVTVEELFAAFPRMRFGIEIKQTETQAAIELCNLIQRVGYEDRVLISSFAQPNMDAFRQACPSVATSATEGEARRFYILHRLRLSGLAGGGGDVAYDAFQLPEYSGGFHLLTERFVSDATDRGLPVVPWTIDNAHDMQRMIALDVAGINTNHPGRLRNLTTSD